MSTIELIVFKGKNSQTGLAFKKEFPVHSGFVDTHYDFCEIKEKMIAPLQAALPIWNSHQGEIDDSYALSMIFENDVKLYYLWPKEIEFQCLIKDHESSTQKKVVSVTVAEAQCSDFITNNNLTFEGKGSTTEAYNIFKNDKEGLYYSVLTAPGSNHDNFDILSNNAENNLNFTTFSILGSPQSEMWREQEWSELSFKMFPPNKTFVGIQMPFSKNFSDSQQALFDRLIDDATTVSEIPKALFVTRHDSSECRILFEANNEFAPTEMLSDEGEDDSITIIPNAGMTACNYSERVLDFLSFQKNFHNADFIAHQGTQTCFFACPILGIVTHGFDAEMTKEIVLKMIDKCFELLASIDLGDTLTPEITLFNKYKEQYFNIGTEFISFEYIN